MILHYIPDGKQFNPNVWNIKIIVYQVFKNNHDEFVQVEVGFVKHSQKMKMFTSECTLSRNWVGTNDFLFVCTKGQRHRLMAS